MARVLKIVTIDWRRYGDYSAVGQLTKRIFSCDSGLEIYSVHIIDDKFAILRHECNVGGAEKAINIGEKVSNLDIQLSIIRPDYIYVRLSPNLTVLSLAVQLIGLSKYKIISHYMDMPSHLGLRHDEKERLECMYREIIEGSICPCVIHESVIEDFEFRYNVRPMVVGNFLECDPCPCKFISPSNSGAITIRYFGGIDYKMNAAALFDFCLAVGGKNWISFEIYSNSGINKEMRYIVDMYSNIKIFPSELDELTYKRKLREADVLMLAYNWGGDSVAYLKHSFSNKILDYLEAGVPIIALGPKGIPTIDAVSQYNLGLLVHLRADIAKIFSRRDDFVAKINYLNEIGRSNVLDFFRSRKSNLEKFLFKLRAGAEESDRLINIVRVLGGGVRRDLYQINVDYFNAKRLKFLKMQKSND